MQDIGSYFAIESRDYTKIRPEVFDPILQAHADDIESFAYIATRMNDDAFYAIRDAQCSDNSRIVSGDMAIEAAQPSVFDALIDDFLDIAWHTRSKLSYGEQLYSARGSQSAGVGAYVTDFTSTDPNNYKESVLTQVYSSSSSKPNMYFRKRPMWTTKQAPYFSMRDRDLGRNSFLMSLPAYNRMANPYRSVDDLRYAKIAIKFKNPEDGDTVQRFVTSCKSRFTPDQSNSIKFKNFFEDT